MRSIDLQIDRWRRRAQTPAPARPTAVPYRSILPVQDQGPSHTRLICTASWSNALGSGLLPRRGAGKHTRGTDQDRALPRGSSRDGLKINTVDLSGSQADVCHCARNPDVLAERNHGVGLRADPAGKRTGYPPLSTEYDRPVGPPSCRLRPVARPSWPGLARRPALPAVRVSIRPPM